MAVDREQIGECTCPLSLRLASDVYHQARKQLHARWPLAGCGVKYAGATTQVVAVGRN